MAMQPIKRYAAFTPDAVDTSEVARMQSLAGMSQTGVAAFTAIGEKLAEAKAPEKAKKAIDEATTVDPVTGEVTREKIEMKSGLGWGNAAYNQQIAVHEEAIRQQYLDGVDRNAQTTLNRLFDENKDNPELFNQVAGEVAKGIVSGVSPEYQGLVGDSLTNSIFNNTEILRSNKRANDITATIQTGKESLGAITNEITAAAAAGEDPTDLVSKAQLRIESLSKLSPEQARLQSSRLKELERSTYEAKVSGDLNRIAEGEGGASAAYAKIVELENNPKKGYGNEEWQAFIQNRKVEVGRTDTLLTASKGVATAEFKDNVTEYQSKAQLGFEITESERIEMTAKVAGTPYESGVAMANQMAEFSVQPQAKRNALIAAAQNSGNATLTQELLRLDDRLQSEVANDAFGLGIKQGYVEYTPINVMQLADDPATPIDERQETISALNARKESASKLSEIYGTNVSVLTKQEAATLAAALPGMNVAQKLSLSEVFGSTSGLWAQIAQDNSAGAFAQVSALGDDTVSKTVFMGQEAITTDKTLAVTGNDLNDANDILDDVVGNVYGNFDKASVREAALNHYYGSNPSRGVLDQNQWKASIQAVTGGIEKVRGVPTQLTGVGVDKVSGRDLDLYFSSFTADNLEDMEIKQITSEVTQTYTSSVRNISQVFQQNQTLDSLANARIEAVEGQGNYVIVQGNGVVTKRDGSTMIFNVTKDKIEAMKGTARGKAMQGTINVNLYGQQQRTQADEALGAFLGGPK